MVDRSTRIYYIAGFTQRPWVEETLRQVHSAIAAAQNVSPGRAAKILFWCRPGS
jgi:hypothetical protein